EAKANHEVIAAETLSVELEKVSVTIPVQVGEEDKLFGSVTSQMISDVLKEKGFEIDKRKIELDDQIKALGIYEVKVKLHPSVSTTIKVWVVRQ
ncbi:MAG: 50S ribosomal protein L9, partial [Candidatus Komeilibacteria bacterium CG_4_9_14_0_8_um_filter_36_9]